jgi:hypothetical protein
MGPDRLSSVMHIRHGESGAFESYQGSSKAGCRDCRQGVFQLAVQSFLLTICKGEPFGYKKYRAGV